MRLALLSQLLLLLLLSSCGPEGREIAREEALEWRAPIHCRIREVYDVLDLRRSTDPNTTHLIEVEIVSGDDAGELLVLPYDEWSVGRKPPSAGRDMVFPPASWVRKSADSRGRPNPIFE